MLRAPCCPERKSPSPTLPRDMTRSTVTGAAGDYNLAFLSPGTYNMKVQAKGFASVAAERNQPAGGPHSDHQPVAQGGRSERSGRGHLGAADDRDHGLERGGLSLANRGFQPADPGPQLLRTGDPDSRRAPGGRLRPDQDARRQHQRKRRRWPPGRHVGGRRRQQGSGRRRPGPELHHGRHPGVQRPTNRYTAEAGHSVAAVVNVVTKSGTNQIHGSAFGLFQNSGLNKNDYFTLQTCAGEGIPSGDCPSRCSTSITTVARSAARSSRTSCSSSAPSSRSASLAASSPIRRPTPTCRSSPRRRPASPAAPMRCRSPRCRRLTSTRWER